MAATPRTQTRRAGWATAIAVAAAKAVVAWPDGKLAESGSGPIREMRTCPSGGGGRSISGLIRFETVDPATALASVSSARRDSRRATTKVADERDRHEQRHHETDQPGRVADIGEQHRGPESPPPPRRSPRGSSAHVPAGIRRCRITAPIRTVPRYEQRVLRPRRLRDRRAHGDRGLDRLLPPRRHH